MFSGPRRWPWSCARRWVRWLIWEVKTAGVTKTAATTTSCLSRLPRSLPWRPSQSKWTALGSIPLSYVGFATRRKARGDRALRGSRVRFTISSRRRCLLGSSLPSNLVPPARTRRPFGIPSIVKCFLGVSTHDHSLRTAASSGQSGAFPVSCPTSRAQRAPSCVLSSSSAYLSRSALPSIGNVQVGCPP